MKKLGLALIILFLTGFYANFSVAETVRESIRKYENSLSSAGLHQQVEIYIRLSELKLSNLYPGAYADARKAYALAQNTGKSSLIADAALQLSSSYLNDIKGIDSALVILKVVDELNRKSGRSNPARYFYNYAKYYSYKKSTHAIIENARKAESLALVKSDFYLCGLSRILLAKAFKQQENRKLFVEYLNLATAALSESADTNRIGLPMMGIGIMLNDAGLPELADKILLKAALICEANADSVSLAFQYANISGIFGAQNMKDRSYNFLQKSVTIFKELKHAKGIAYSSNLMGQHYFEIKEYEKANTYFNESAKLASSMKDWQLACFAASNTVECLVYLKKFGEAKTTLTRAAEYSKLSNDDLAFTAYHYAAGIYYNALGDFKKSVSEFQSCMMYAYKIKNANFLMNSMKAVADNYEHSGDEKEAAYYYKRYIEVRDSVNQIAQSGRREELLDNFEEQSISEFSIKNKSKYSLLFYVIALLILILSVTTILVLLYKNRQKARKLKSSFNEQAQELNDFPNTDSKTGKLQLNDMLQKEIWEKLIHFMETEHLYRNTDLSLSELSEKIDSNTTYVSKVINDIADSNFVSFINRYRIEEACLLLSDPNSAHLSIEGIALTVGFHSKSAFNTAFKKFKGKTPSDYAAQKNGKRLS